MKFFMQPPPTHTLLDDLHQIQEDLSHCDHIFNSLSDPYLTECCIFQRKALLAQYSYLLNLLKNTQL